MMSTTRFVVNGREVAVAAAPETALLWVIREHLQLTGTKYACGVAQCGACTVHVDGELRRACVTSLASVAGKSVTTIEGLSAHADHPLQRAWIAEQVPQCGYCQSGQLMTAAVLLRTTPNPSRKQIVEAMDGVLCRCGTYLRIIKAIERAAAAPAPGAAGVAGTQS
jgi:isoquinoline 1-oxidoreductase alpha subunit